MKYILILALILTGCSGGGSSSQPEPKDKTAIWYGDSRCTKNPYLPVKKCVSGKQLVEVDQLDPSYSIIIIHMGHNDMKRGKVPVPLFKAHLDYLIADIREKVWCILPTPINYYVEPHIVESYRQAMLDTCINTRDPQIEGYADDRIHYTDYNYQQVLAVYDEILSSYK